MTREHDAPLGVVSFNDRVDRIARHRADQRELAGIFLDVREDRRIARPLRGAQAPEHRLVKSPKRRARIGTERHDTRFDHHFVDRTHIGKIAIELTAPW